MQFSNAYTLRRTYSVVAPFFILVDDEFRIISCLHYTYIAYPVFPLKQAKFHVRSYFLLYAQYSGTEQIFLIKRPLIY